MKLKLNLKNKEVSLDADIEKLIEKGIINKPDRPERKTAYQIRQEEKRKNEELKHKQQLQSLYILLGLFVFLVVFGMIATILKI